MTLERVFQKNDFSGVPLLKLIRQHNPFKGNDVLFSKAGMTMEEAMELQKNPDNLTIKQLNRILALCEFDLKLTALFDDDLQEVNISDDQLSEVYIKEDMDWDEDLSLDEEPGEDFY